MEKQKFPRLILVFLISLFLTSAIFSQTQIKEALVYKSLQRIHRAQITYQATVGNGKFARDLQSLAFVDFIDQPLATGEKYGYQFTLDGTEATLNPSFYSVTATPIRYPRNGRRSFYIDSKTGVVRGADKKGADAVNTDPFIIICGENEREAIESLRWLVGGQFTYQATMGNGNFGSLTNLYDLGVIDYFTAEGSRCGYNLTVTKEDKTAANPPRFHIVSVPQQYGVSGHRSFYVDQTGVIRGADKKGQPASVSDPPIEY